MNSITDMMHSGGPFMWALFGLLLFAIPLTMILGGIAAAKIRIPMIAWLLFPLLLVMLGVAGTWQGMTQVVAAVGYASPEMRQPLASAGYSVSLLSSAGGLVMAAGVLLMGAWGAAVGALRGESESRSGAALAIAGGTLALLGGVGTALLSVALGSPTYAPGAALLLGAPALVLSSIRHGTSAADRVRQSENRLSAAVCVLSAVLCVALAAVLRDTIAMHEALAHASDEVRMRLMFIAVSGQDAALLLLPVAAAVAALSGAVACASGLRDIPIARILTSAGLAGMGLAFSAGVTLAVSQQHSLLTPLWSAYSLEGIGESVAGLPQSSQHGTGTQSVSSPTHVLHHDGSGWSQRQPDGSTAPLTLPLPEESAPLLVVPGDRPARLISTADWGADATPLSILLAPVQSPDITGSRWLEAAALRTVPLQWLPQAQPEPPDDGLPRAVRRPVYFDDEVIFVLPDSSGVALQRPDHGRDQLASLQEASAALRDRLVSDPLVHSVVLVPDADWTVQDVAALCADVVGARAEEPAECAVMAGYSPPIRPIDSGDAPGDDGTMSHLGALDRDDIKAVIQRSQGGFKYCYEKGLQKNPGLSGRVEVEVKIVIAATGKVSQATVETSSLNDEAVEQCLADRFRRLQFPEPDGGGIVIVRYPLVFTAQ